LGELNQSSALLLAINDGAFRSDANVQQIISHYITPPTVNNVNTFDGINKSIPVYVERESIIDEYESATGWSLFTNYLPIHAVQNVNAGDADSYNVSFLRFLTDGAQVVDSTVTDLQTIDSLSITTFGSSSKAKISNSNEKLIVTSLHQLKFFGLLSLPVNFADGCSNIVDISFPSSLVSIPNYCCRNCTSLVSIELGNSVSTIGTNAFENCTSLVSMIFVESLTKINSYAFQRCTSLEEVDLKDTHITEIGGSGFRYCSGVTTLTLPSTLTKLNSSTFEGCTSLQEITCYATTPPTISSNTFTNVSKSISLKVPSESLNAYMSANYWKTFTNIQAIS
jgi:hypothetical protein